MALCSHPSPGDASFIHSMRAIRLPSEPCCVAVASVFAMATICHGATIGAEQAISTTEVCDFLSCPSCLLSVAIFLGCVGQVVWHQFFTHLPPFPSSQHHYFGRVMRASLRKHKLSTLHSTIHISRTVVSGSTLAMTFIKSYH